jgi:type IV secretion system protein VirB5
MKKVLVGVVLSALASVSFAQIPVTDGAAIARHTASQVETIAKWKMQYDQMVSQIDQQKQQYQSVTGTRNLGNIRTILRFGITCRMTGKAFTIQ